MSANISAFLGNLAAYLSGRGIFLISKFIAIVLLSRALNQEDFALYTTIIFATTIISSVSTLGIDKSCVLYFSRGLNTNYLFSLVLLQVLLFGSVLVLFTYYLISWWTQVFGYLTTTFKILIVANIPLLSLGINIEGIFVGEKRFLMLAARTSIRWVTQMLIFLILFLAHKLTLITAIYVNLFTNIIGIILFLPLITLKHYPKLTWDSKFYRDCYGYGFKLYVVDLLYLVFMRLDYFFASVYDNAINLGYYAFATNLNGIILHLPLAIYYVIFPRVAESTTGSTALSFKICRMIFFIMLIWIFILLGMGHFLISLIGGEKYFSAYNILIIQYLFIPFTCLYLILLGLISGLNQPNILLKTSIINIGVLLALNIMLTPTGGIYGAALAKVLSSIFLLFSTLAYLKRIMQFSIIDVIMINKNDFKRLYNLRSTLFSYKKLLIK